MVDLEVWVIGTSFELDAAARKLAALGFVVYRSERVALAGKDSGRWRAYARIRVAGAYPQDPASGQPGAPDTLTDFAA